MEWWIGFALFMLAMGAAAGLAGYFLRMLWDIDKRGTLIALAIFAWLAAFIGGGVLMADANAKARRDEALTITIRKDQ
jgi:hypothetical protein